MFKTLLVVFVLFFVGVFAEHDFGVVDMVREGLGQEKTAASNKCNCGVLPTVKAKACSCKGKCTCCSACPGQGGTSECRCQPSCGCCKDCPGHKKE